MDPCSDHDKKPTIEAIGGSESGGNDSDGYRQPKHQRDDDGDTTESSVSRGKRKKKRKEKQKRRKETKKSESIDNDDSSSSSESDRRKRKKKSKKKKHKKKSHRDEEGDKGVRRSAITGKKIKMKVKKTKDDLAQEKARKDLLDFMNASYDG